MMLLEELGFCIPEGTVLVEEESEKWPARSPDLNWMDEFVWGYMVSEMGFVTISSRKDLRKAIKKIWKEKITTEFCQNAITHYWKMGDPNCAWWQWNGIGPDGKKTKDPCKCGGHGTLAEVIKRKGDRISLGKKSDVVADE